MTHLKPRNPDALPEDKRLALRDAQRLEWLTLGLRMSVAGALYLALGGTQALTAVWLKSLWALLPPVAFLVACRVEQRAPRPRFPYGFYRAGTIAFLAGALALGAMGVFLCYTGLHGLVTARTSALATLWASPFAQWHGWLVIAALAYSIAVPMITGGARQRLAIALHDKGLYADATMGRANWLAGTAAIVGVLGIGLGLWWVDWVATLVIGADILRYGARHTRTAVCDLIDEVPRRLDTGDVDPLGARIHSHLVALDWVADARVRLREEGRRLTGMAFVCPQADTAALLDRLAQTREEIERLDWRLLDFELVPVDARRCAAQMHIPGA